MIKKSNVNGNLQLESAADEYADVIKEKEFDTVSQRSRGGDVRTLSSYKKRLYKALRSSSHVVDMMDLESKLNYSVDSKEDDEVTKLGDHEE